MNQARVNAVAQHVLFFGSPYVAAAIPAGDVENGPAPAESMYAKRLGKLEVRFAPSLGRDCYSTWLSWCDNKEGMFTEYPVVDSPVCETLCQALMDAWAEMDALGFTRTVYVEQDIECAFLIRKFGTGKEA